MTQALTFALAILLPATICGFAVNRFVRSRVGAALIAGAITTLVTHAIAWVVDGGFDSLVAVSVVVVFLLASAIGRVIGQFVKPAQIQAKRDSE